MMQYLAHGTNDTDSRANYGSIILLVMDIMFFFRYIIYTIFQVHVVKYINIKLYCNQN